MSRMDLQSTDQKRTDPNSLDLGGTDLNEEDAFQVRARTYGDRSIKTERHSIALPAIVASLGSDALLTAQKAKAMGADMIEVRLDLIREFPLDVISEIRERCDLPIIATARIKSEGGSLIRDDESRASLLLEASEHADIVDVEFKSDYRDRIISSARTPVLLSYHDWSGIPSNRDIGRLHFEMMEAGAAISKIAVTPSSISEIPPLLSLLLTLPGSLCLIAMGSYGRHFRAVAPVYGSALTYGYVLKPVAPGQISVGDLRRMFEIFGIRG
jgi:3-dehydroquinate dehydratase-1